MSFRPVIPFSGLQGWLYLSRTREAQLESFGAAPGVARDIAHFREQIGTVRGAEALAGDRRLRQVALGAFGLQQDLPNRHFVERLLGDGTTAGDALANRLADTRYRQFSAAFGLGPGERPRTADPEAMAEIAERYLRASFEEAVGAQDDTMRIALFAQRELGALAAGPESETTKWYTILGQPPLRALFETALGLPASFGQADLDRQVAVFEERVRAMTGDGTVSQFAGPEAMDRLITVYHARAQIGAVAASASPAATALALLQARP